MMWRRKRSTIHHNLLVRRREVRCELRFAVCARDEVLKKELSDHETQSLAGPEAVGEVTRARASLAG